MPAVTRSGCTSIRSEGARRFCQVSKTSTGGPSAIRRHPLQETLTVSRPALPPALLLLEAEKQFHPVHGYRELPVLRAGLAAHNERVALRIPRESDGPFRLNPTVDSDESDTLHEGGLAIAPR